MICSLYDFRNTPMFEDRSEALGGKDSRYEAYIAKDLFGSYFTAPLRSYEEYFLSNEKKGNLEVSLFSDSVEFVKELALVVMDCVARVFLVIPAYVGIAINSGFYASEKLEESAKKEESSSSLFSNELMKKMDIETNREEEPKFKFFPAKGDVVSGPASGSFEDWRASVESKQSDRSEGGAYVKYEFSFDEEIGFIRQMSTSVGEGDIIAV